MRKKRKHSLTFFVVLLAIAVLLTTASIRALAENIDCRFCHMPGGDSDAKDLSKYYLNPPDVYPFGNQYHFNHSISKIYPTGLNASQEYKLPNGRITGVAFFDRNGNGQPDSNEIQLFSMIDVVTGEVISGNSEVTIECASCHKVHNDDSEDDSSDDSFLRMQNNNSEMCLTCHNK